MEYKYKKWVNTFKIAKEIREQLGLVLMRENLEDIPEGAINTVEDEITISCRELTDTEKAILDSIIERHDPSEWEYVLVKDGEIGVGLTARLQPQFLSFPRELTASEQDSLEKRLGMKVIRKRKLF